MNYTRFCSTNQFYFDFPEGYHPPQVSIESTTTDEDPSKTLQYCKDLVNNPTASYEAKKVAKDVLSLKDAVLLSDSFCTWHNAPGTISAQVSFNTVAQLSIFVNLVKYIK
jgi:hypothetical protein